MMQRGFSVNFAIENDVPTPHRSQGPRVSYPFREMKVGDSFVVPEDYEPQVRTSACAYGRRHGKIFTVRKRPEGIRVWRME
jgi:uncharacterized protein (DUF2249 family)